MKKVRRGSKAEKAIPGRNKNCVLDPQNVSIKIRRRMTTKKEAYASRSACIPVDLAEQLVTKEGHFSFLW